MSEKNELLFRVGLASTLGAGLERDQRAVERFTNRSTGLLSRMRGEVGRLNADLNGFSSITRLAGAAGALYKAREAVVSSANLDRDLARIGKTADMSREEIVELRKELWKMSSATGQARADLQTAFDGAVQSGLKFREALPVIQAVNTAVAVTHANASALTSGLTVAAEAFQFDLAKPQMALDLLDKMTVAGRQGNAELENLADIFARVGVNAASAGMSFDKTLAFIEVLSLVEKNPERLATLTDSTLRVFNNRNYREDATKATGVQFFNADKSRRDATKVLADFKSKYDRLTTDADRDKFFARAFGKTDLDTQKGMRTLLAGDRLGQIDQFAAGIGNARGALSGDLSGALDNAIDQAGRLQAVMGRAADAFIAPINKFATVPLLEAFVDGGAGSRAAIVAGAAGLGIAARMAWKRRNGGGAAGAAGDAIDGMGLQRVFVTNWPRSMLGPGEDLKAKRDARGGPLTPGGAAGAPAGASRGARAWGGAKGALRWGAPLAIGLGAFDAYGTYMDDSLSQKDKNVAYGGILGGTGGGLAGAAAGAAAGALLGPIGAIIGGLLGGAAGYMGGEKIGGEIVVRLEDDRVRVSKLQSDNPDVPISVDTGAMFVSP